MFDREFIKPNPNIPDPHILDLEDRLGELIHEVIRDLIGKQMERHISDIDHSQILNTIDLDSLHQSLLESNPPIKIDKDKLYKTLRDLKSMGVIGMFTQPGKTLIYLKQMSDRNT